MTALISSTQVCCTPFPFELAITILNAVIPFVIKSSWDEVILKCYHKSKALERQLPSQNVTGLSAKQVVCMYASYRVGRYITEVSNYFRSIKSYKGHAVIYGLCYKIWLTQIFFLKLFPSVKLFMLISPSVSPFTCFQELSPLPPSSLLSCMGRRSALLRALSWQQTALAPSLPWRNLAKTFWKSWLVLRCLTSCWSVWPL